jgi:predicted ArsR family transcriptional regulator
LTKLARPFDLLAQWGYQPELRTVDNTRCADFTLRDCPFLDMAAARPDVVCAVHHGILRGAMELEGEPSAEIAIRPFVGPRTCTVHITQGRNPRE